MLYLRKNLVRSSMQSYIKNGWIVLLTLCSLISVYVFLIILTHGWQESLLMFTSGFPSEDSSKAFQQRQVPTATSTVDLPVLSAIDFPNIIKIPTLNNSRVNLEKFLGKTETRAFVIIRDDHVIYEKYFNGSSRDSLQLSFSSTKSFMSTLIGIAIDEGRIGSLYDPVIQYIPELKAKGLDRLTIRDLLTMSSGVPFQNSEVFPLLAPFTDDAKLFYASDARKHALNVHGTPENLRKYFHYNDYYPLLEGIILERVTGRNVSQYLSEKIWQPLGMTAPASWNLDHASAGMEKTEDGLNARAIDFARFGLLFLNRGHWRGKQLVPAAWVNDATSFDPTDHRPWQGSAFWPKRGGFYKYHWWGIHTSTGADDYFALGHMGQIIFVSPIHHAVVVRFGGDSRPTPAWPFIIRDILNQLPPQL